MERLSLNETAGNTQQQQQSQSQQQQHQQQQQQQRPGQQNALGSAVPQAQSGPPQLPPQMFTTAAQLLDLTDKKLVLVLRDGRKLIGVLRSWDQFANLVLQDTIERIYAGNLYADVPRGIFLVRGENVLLLGEVDLDREDDIPSSVTKAPFEEVFELKKKEDSQRKTTDKKRHGELQALGFEPEHSGEILF
ncbi:U6 snRNA-associated Sm-like protein LSm1 [Penicillium diatomitis]|uniref:U6 snRNA-associated Sm-like protein LSm1 n=1 Tax=Penicillium diatomitis TaxID=2819901 RepID=A0A9X0BTW8_9EURO|nr:U6 snRNA-associated Sm-like protein LSm1 [Penicillium diatomitis]KAJ5484088.1 U6 snRNA-associated Sm-like protein LSm1 [Penicillium diatomitis]